MGYNLTMENNKQLVMKNQNMLVIKNALEAATKSGVFSLTEAKVVSNALDSILAFVAKAEKDIEDKKETEKVEEVK